MATDSEVLPDPELPAMPIMEVFAHGGEYRAPGVAQSEDGEETGTSTSEPGGSSSLERLIGDA